MQHFNSTVTRGDIVWARVRFPYQFLPALVLSIDEIGIFVSFFNHRLSPLPRYVIESEVVPFEQSFRWVMNHRHLHFKDFNECETFYALLDSALKLMGTRVLSSLKCRCLVIQSKRGLDGSNKSRSCCVFQPLGVLGFVKKVAVFPWVDEVDFVDAVSVVAQVHAFRGYCSVEQKGVYQKTQGRGNGMKLLQCSSLGEKMNSVSQDSVTSKLKYESQAPLKEEEKNLAGRRLNSRIPVLKGNINSLYKNQLQITPHTHIRKRKAEFLQEISPHMQSLTFGPFYLWGGNLIEYIKHELFRFNKMLEKNIVDSFFEILRKMSKHHHSIPCNILTQLSYSFSGSGDIKNLTYFTKKRRRLDHHSLCDSSFKLQKLSSFSTNVASINKEDDSDVFTSSASAICFSSCDKMENSDSYLTSFLQSSKKFKIRNPCSNRILSETFISGFSSSCNYLFKFSSCQAGFPLKDRVQETEEKAHVSKYSEAKMLQLGRTTSYRQNSCNTCSKFLHIKFPKNYKLPSKCNLIEKFRVFGSVNYLETKVSSVTGAAKVAFFQEADALTAYLYAKRKKVRFGGANVRFWLDPLEHKRGRSSEYHTLMSPSISEQVPLKSCLKHSSSQEKDNRKKPYKVRFTIVTD